MLKEATIRKQLRRLEKANQRLCECGAYDEDPDGRNTHNVEYCAIWYTLQWVLGDGTIQPPVRWWLCDSSEHVQAVAGLVERRHNT